MATAAAPLLDAEVFSAASERDALGRVLKAISPDDSDNARGQREQVVHGPTVSPTTTTSYSYDPQTYRLAHLSTTRASDNKALQGLHYHYDPVGNITDIRDTAQQTVYFQNAVVEAANSYEYDAVYRLIEANGREHSTQGTSQRTHEQLPVGPQPMTSDPSAMRHYTQKYTYDSVGNILEMQHIPASGTGWTHHYEYAANGNRLLATSAPGDPVGGPYTHTYSYDAHGSMMAMPHMSTMVWNYDDELQKAVVGTESVYFQYAEGIRSRKYVEESGSTAEERIYLGPFEIYRKRVNGTLDLERESLHISDGSGRICIIETKTIDSGSVVGSPTGIWRYQLSNHLGSAVTEVDGSGSIISYEEYHPYGTSAYRAVDASIGVSAKRYRYTGMERDEETSLDYHLSRYYIPWLGRWSACDPIGLLDGANRFRYVSDNPITYRDSSGNSKDTKHFTEEQLSKAEGKEVYIGTVDVEASPGVTKEPITIVTEAVYEYFRDYAEAPDFSYESVKAELQQAKIEFSGGAFPAEGEFDVKLDARLVLELANRFEVRTGDDGLLFPELDSILGIEGTADAEDINPVQAKAAEIAEIALELGDKAYTAVTVGAGAALSNARTRFLKVLTRRGESLGAKQTADVAKEAAEEGAERPKAKPRRSSWMQPPRIQRGRRGGKSPKRLGTHQRMRGMGMVAERRPRPRSR